LKNLTDAVALDDFIAVLRAMTTTYKASIQAAVAVEAETAKLQPANNNNNNNNKAVGDAPALVEDKKGKGREMDIDESSPPPAAVSVEPFVRINLQNLAETAVAFTMEAGEYIECMSNSLGLTAKPKDDDSAVATKVGPVLAAALVDFVLDMLTLCSNAEHTEAGAQLVDQTMVIAMKTLVFARHRIYLKLRILVPFVEAGGLKLFCKVLETMWTWAASLPPVADDSSAADPHARLRKVLDNVLESMLSILSFVLDGEPVAECPEYLALCQEHESEATWFRPGHFVAELRLQAMPVLQFVWESRLLVSGGNTQIMGSFIGCLGPVLSAQHESSPSSSATPSSRQAATGGDPTSGSNAAAATLARLGLHYQELLERRRTGLAAAAAGSRSAAGAHTPIPTLGGRLFGSSLSGSGNGAASPSFSPAVVPNPAHVTELLSLGFSREQAEAALVRNFNSLARAANDLFSGDSALPPPPPPAETGESNEAGESSEPAARAEHSPHPPPASADTQEAEPMAVDTTTTAEPSPTPGGAGESSAQQGPE
ncbi:hypothetical protein GGI00_005201, partial [Coemansia sp. RSA 2681]